jgi:NAD(P)-dependent dehydrogenase (short-subunit alcohol dehydrogenase family)
VAESTRVLLTGATGTVGSAILAGLLGRPGYAVVAVGRRRPAVPGEPHQHALVDLADPAATENAARQLAAVTFGAAVFTAGIDSRQGLVRLAPAVFSRVMQVNCLSHLQLLQHVAAASGLDPHRPLRVAAVSSDVLGGAQPGTAVYAASKAALEEGLRHAAGDIALRLLLLRLPYIGVDMAETGEAGITPRPVPAAPPPLACEAAAVTLRFLASPDSQPCTEVWP